MASPVITKGGVSKIALTVAKVEPLAWVGQLRKAFLGRPHLDVQQTSALASSLAIQPSQNSDGTA